MESKEYKKAQTKYTSGRLSIDRCIYICEEETYIYI